jgi:hypothetical protein
MNMSSPAAINNNVYGSDLVRKDHRTLVEEEGLRIQTLEDESDNQIKEKPMLSD